jgi:hypothetical protein
MKVEAPNENSQQDEEERDQNHPVNIAQTERILLLRNRSYCLVKTYGSEI